MKKQVVQELMLNVIDTLIAIVNANIDNLDGETIARIAMICDTKRYPIETILSELNKEIQTHLLWAFGSLKFYFSFIFHLCFPFIIKFIFIQNLRIYYYEEVTKKLVISQAQKNGDLEFQPSVYLKLPFLISLLPSFYSIRNVKVPGTTNLYNDIKIVGLTKLHNGN